jgi:hypothetical protein
VARSAVRSVGACLTVLMLVAGCGGQGPAITVDPGGHEVDGTGTGTDDVALALDGSQDGTTHVDETVEVSGRATPGSTVTVDGLPGGSTAGPDGRFRIVVALQPGANDIVIRARAPDGSESTSELRLFRDPPSDDDVESSP